MPKKYEKLDQITHIHKRPDMYVGTIKSKKEENEWISSSSNSDNPKFVKKDISYSQALLRIFVEPLSNAIDNVWRSKNTKTPCTTIRVNIDKETGMIKKIPALVCNKLNRKFTLKREKKLSTLKSLAPKKAKTKCFVFLLG